MPAQGKTAHRKELCGHANCLLPTLGRPTIAIDSGGSASSSSPPLGGGNDCDIAHAQKQFILARGMQRMTMAESFPPGGLHA
eukprot:1156560-Pelagomonas_calceolata.AAC.3